MILLVILVLHHIRTGLITDGWTVQENCFNISKELASTRQSNLSPVAGSIQGVETQSTSTPAAIEVEPAVGLNKFDLFLQYLGRASGGDGSPRYRKVTRAMARKAILDAKNIGVAYLRVSATGYAPDRFNRRGDLDLWRNNPAVYWCLFDQMMNDLHSSDVRIIPVFVWNWTQFPAVTGETASEMITDHHSKSFQLLQRYITEFVTRYKNHPALYFYELTNELNLKADLDMVDRCQSGKLGSYERCGPIGNFSTDQMIAFTSGLATYIRRLDPNHLISSGFTIPRPSAEHLRRKPGFSSDGPDWTLDSLAEFRKNLMDIHSGMDIVSIHFYNRPGNNERFGVTGRNNADLLNTIKQSSDEMGKELFVGEFGDYDPFIRDDKSALFTQNVLNKIVELKIPYSAVWVWQFYDRAPYLTYDNRNTFFNLEPGYTDLVISKIKETNEKLGNDVPPPPSPDTIPPQVVLTWPLEGSTISCDQFIHAVASDDSGSVIKVEFLVDGEVKATITDPPYQFSLDTTQLDFYKQQITAKAHDPSGNVGEYTVTAKPRPCLY